MEIRTERLLLRPITMADLMTTHAYVSDAENTHFMMNLPCESLEETAQEIAYSVAQWQAEEPERLELAILHDGRHIGAMTFFFQEDRSSAELGWVLHKEHWGKGFATEAAQALISYARQHWGLTHLFACCDSENKVSAHLMEKLGMHFACSANGRRNRGMEGDRIELTYEVSFGREGQT